MRLFRILLCGISILIMLCSFELKAQVQTTMGTDFWMGFIEQFDNSIQTRLSISSDVAASGTVAVPGQAWSTPFTVAANATTIITIPTATVYVGTSEVITAKGVHITSNNPVGVVASTYTAVRSETALILPTPLLGTEYFAASYAPGNYNFTSEFMVVATTNGTIVDITPTSPTAGGKPANVQFSVTLNAGDVYQVKAANSGAKDLTGSKISVSASSPCKTIAVMAGMTDAYVPASVCATANPLFEEMNPVTVWGTDYVVPPFFSSTGSQVRIIASQAATSVVIDGGAPINLNAGQFNEQSFNGNVHCITANKPIQVVQYMKGNACSGATPNKGDPSMLVLNSNKQMIRKYVFTPYNNSIAARFVNVVMKTPYTAQLQLDGASVNPTWTAVPNCTGYSYATLSITNAFHTLFADSSFVGYLYGYGSGDDAFSNPLGWSINLPSAVTPTITGTTSICTGASTTLSAGNTYTTYSWSPGGQTTSAITITPVSTSTYTVSVTSACGSGTGTVQVTVTVPPAPTISGTTSVCSGNTTTLTASGGTTYSWNTGATTTAITVTPTVATTYTVTAGTGGCTGATTLAVTITPGPTPAISGTTTVCPGESTTLTAGGGGTYTWSTSATTTAITVTPASTTTYTLTTNSGGCTGSTTVVVTVGSGIVPVITGTTSICPGTSTTLTATGGGSYSWSTGATSAAITVSPSSTTSYSVTVISGSCTGTATVNVNILTPPSPAITGTTVICNGSNTTLTTTAGDTYLWNTGATTTSITVTPGSSTTYTVTATTSGCTGSTTAIVTVNSNPTPVINGTTTICSGTSTSLTATAGGTYSWDTGATTAAITVSPASNTTYTVTVTNAGCTGSATVEVTVAANLIPVITGTTTICNGESTTLSTSGGGTYSWSDASTGTSITVSPTGNTTYSVTVTNGSCSGTASVEVTVVNNPTPAITGNTSVCPGTTTTLTANGGTTYIWDNGATTTSITVSPSSATTYTVTASTSGCTGQTTIAVSITPPPSPTITGTTAICNGGTTTLTATAGGSYSWNTGATTAAITVSPLSTSTYTVIVTTVCSASATIEVIVQANLVPSITGTISICNGSSTTLSTSGGGTYMWSDGSTGSSITVSPAATTTYSVTVTNGTCSGTAEQPVTVNQNPVPVITGNTTICNGSSTTLTANAGGTYSWNTGATTAAITVSPASNTSYTVTVTTNGCTGSATAGVTVNPIPAPVISGTSSICAGQGTTLTSSTSGPYSWSTGATTATITVSPSGTQTYSLSVTVNGCTGTAAQIVTVVPLVVATITGNDICEGESVTLTASGGTNYVWNIGATTNTITETPVSTTTYTVIAATGSCADTATYTVTVNPIPTVTATGTTTISYGNSTPLTATGGGTYNWLPPDGLSCTNCESPTATPTATTQYCVTVTQSGCQDSACVIITIDTKCGDNGELFVPNGFSPNGDGQNDVLYVRGGGATSIFWVIYDRWGEKVFETTDPKQGWDGTYQGKELDPAVFVYYLRVTCFSGDEIKQKGNVAIIK